MLDHATGQWATVFRRCDDNPGLYPPVHEVVNEYRAEIADAKTPMELPDLQGWQLHAKAAKRKPHKAGGLDGWKTIEAQQWPVEIWNDIATMFQAIEGGLPWPSVLAWGFMPLIPKPKSDPEDVLTWRALTVMGVTYSTWASVRYKHSREWMDKVLLKNSFGGRHGKEPVMA